MDDVACVELAWLTSVCVTISLPVRIILRIKHPTASRSRRASSVVEAAESETRTPRKILSGLVPSIEKRQGSKLSRTNLTEAEEESDDDEDDDEGKSEFFISRKRAFTCFRRVDNILIIFWSTVISHISSVSCSRTLKTVFPSCHNRLDASSVDGSNRIGPISAKEDCWLRRVEEEKVEEGSLDVVDDNCCCCCASSV